MGSIRRPRAVALLLCLVAACSKGAAPPPVEGSGGDFFVLATDPPAQAQVFLNDTIAITFTADVDLTSADLNAVSFAVFDLNGVALQEQPRGRFAVRTASGPDAGNRRVLEFHPAFPTDDQFGNGGLRPGRRYLLQIASGDPRNGAVLRSTGGKALREPFTLPFLTVTGDQPAQLFRDQLGSGPLCTGVEVTPAVEGLVCLGKRGARPVEVRLHFDQPLNPASTNLPTALDLDASRLDRRSAARGRVSLEYDDAVLGAAAWLPASAVVERNSNAGATLLLVPQGVLPNDAEVRVIVEAELEDLSGQANAAGNGHARVAGVFRTQRARAPQFDAIVENFTSAQDIDFDAPLLEPLAEVGAGYARAALAFAGASTEFDYRPNVREVVLNTDFTQITPQNGAPFNVSGGVFEFRNVTIPAGVTVRGVGSKPMVWLVTGDFVVEGELSVAGGDGARVDTLNSANFPTAGGVGVCGGGNGGRGSPSAVAVDRVGETGYGAGQVPGGGGPGGQHSCTVQRMEVGGGGGGGSFATQGDPYYYMGFGPGTLPSVTLGRGGAMQRLDGTATGPQAAAGPLAFRDVRVDNDFYGALVDLSRTPARRVVGEILAPRGGAGGGGGGDSGPLCNNPGDFTNDRKGGGGGAGGGVLIVQALRRIIIKGSGVINANGGHGGGGEEAGSNSRAGGGGGGSGGMVVLMSGGGIHVVAHGRPYVDGGPTSNLNGAYTFAVQADGGVGTRGSFAGPGALTSKYPGVGGPTGTNSFAGAIGGFGGLGLVQLMAPPGDNANDDTNTALDDRIYFYPDDRALQRGLDSRDPHQAGAFRGADKIDYLGWRGFTREDGTRRDDSGSVVRLRLFNQGGEGDIRPSPILLPSPLGPLSRLRSRWIDTGVTARIADPAARARGIDEQLDASAPDDPLKNLTAGPTYVFGGTFSDAAQPQGYVAYAQADIGVERVVSEVLPRPLPVAAVRAASYDGAAAYRVELAEASEVLGRIPGRLTGYRARLRSVAGSTLAGYRILDHDALSLTLSADAGPLPSETVGSVQVAAEFFGFGTTDAEGFGPTQLENGREVPLANVRIGFAFHADPARPRLTSPDHDADRYPHRPGTFLHALDLQRPEHIRAIRALGKDLSPARGATAVQWDLLFNTAFSAAAAGNIDDTRLPDPSAPRPELRFLVLPYQY